MPGCIGTRLPVEDPLRPVLFSDKQKENIGAKMVPLYAARIKDLGSGDFVKVDRADNSPNLKRPS